MLAEVEYYGDGTVGIINKPNPPAGSAIYYFFAYSHDGSESVFVGMDRKQLEDRKTAFLSVHEKNKASMVMSYGGIKIFELKKV